MVETQLRIYEVPQGLESKSGYAVTVNGRPLGLYDAKVLFPPFQYVKRAPFGLFDFEGEAVIEITPPVEVRQVDIRPKSRKIPFELREGKIRIVLTRPEKFSVELNGGIEYALHLFANPLERWRPEPDGKDVIYFAPGVHHIGDYEIPSGKTVYLAGGAYVYGKLITEKDSENIRIFGRGILDGRDNERGGLRTVELQFTRDAYLEGITIVDAPNWTCRVFGSDRVNIYNVNIFGWRGNTDGVDVCGSRHVDVSGMFIRNWDDALAVKAFNTGDVDEVYFHDCIVWNDYARPIEVGYENSADRIHNVRYRDIDIIHSMSGYPLIGIHQGDRAEIYDILFENIRVEDALGGQFIDLRIKPSAWNADGRTGRIHGVTFRNIYLNGKPGLDKLPEKSRIEGYSETSTIEDIVFDNVYISGRRITSAEECGLNCLAYTKNIRFLPPAEPVPEEELLVPVQTELKILSSVLGDHGIYDVTAVVTARNCSEKDRAKGEFWVEAYPKTECAGLENGAISYDLNPGEKLERRLSFSLRSGKYFVTTQSKIIDVKLDWTLLELETPVPELESPDRASLEEFSRSASQEFYNLQGEKAGGITVARSGGSLLIGGEIFDRARADDGFQPVVDDPDMVYSCLNVPKKEACIDIYVSEKNPPAQGEVMFLIPETGFGETTALQMGGDGPVVASELRNIAEITYVFKNQPKVRGICHISLDPAKIGERTEKGYRFFASLPMEQLGIAPGQEEFLMELLVNTVLPGADHFDSVAMYHSLRPESCVQMFGRYRLV